MTLGKLLNWKLVVALMFVPIISMVIAFLAAGVQGQIRYNPAYFTEEYVNRYQDVSTFLNDLEIALQNGDTDLMAVLQGTRRVPEDINANPNIRYSFLLDRQGPYNNYIYWDIETFERSVQHVKEVNGRMVVVPASLYYYVDSGTWPVVFTPLALYWWSFVAVITAGVLVYRALAVVRRQIFGNP